MEGDFYLRYLDPRFPLLQKLREKALGTYFHSHLVAEMGYSIARVMENTDPLLVYFGGLYHDIGKIAVPEAFAENQDTISNTDFDAEAILSHVEKGYLLAKSFHFPKPLCNIIRSHHGTSVAPNPNKEIKVRYTGKKPSTREETIVFLTDSIEAAVRSERNQKLTPSDFRRIVDEVIRAKRIDRQLSLSPFQEADYLFLQEDFVHILDRMHHSRPEWSRDIRKQ